jgi:hypothetical protein
MSSGAAAGAAASGGALGGALAVALGATSLGAALVLDVVTPLAVGAGAPVAADADGAAFGAARSHPMSASAAHASPKRALEMCMNRTTL